MTPITCIIVDDEPLAVKLLESFVAKTPQLQLLRSFTDSVEALSLPIFEKFDSQSFNWDAFDKYINS